LSGTKQNTMSQRPWNRGQKYQVARKEA